ncbi:hypothetical protein GCM10010967_19310 [Dyadobacter beijingensis]|uniref:TonB C-terminal domain-containing protein n=1 Tax=Dyadobacter beijingensis TaxID=365489 RepID=A0ABQ2HNI4_9BACT|nr:hypothetical protein [Dyadobacter beijingensis]GGM87091.1 hypothetical protein GCM10010967_19310 [Dyadobacter beijingensis]
MAVTNDFIPDFDDFERYFGGQMPAAEQRALEGRMVDEPLVAEAYEGFLAWRTSHPDIAGMRVDLHARLRARVGRRDKRILPLWAYASAASVLLLLFAYWAFFLRDSEGLMQESAAMVARENAAKPSSPTPNEPAKASDAGSEAAQPVPATPPLSSYSKPTGSATASEAEKSESVQAPDFVLKPYALAPAVAEVVEKKEQITVPQSDSGSAQTTPAQTAPAPEPASALTAPGASQAVAQSAGARAKAAPSKPSFAARKTGDANDNAAPETLNEVVVTGSSFSRKKSISTPLVELDRPEPLPVGGWDAYRAYLDKNTDSSAIAGQVVVTFVVGESGALSGFMAKGPVELHNAAIRIVRQGPAWLPVRMKGVAASTLTEIRLEFRR